MTQEFVTLPREVVKNAISALRNTETESASQYKLELDSMKALQLALEQPQAEQEPIPNGATHIQLQQGAFYKRVDGKWYVWSLMKNGEPHRWYISPGTAESCLEPLATTPKQKREPLTDEKIIDIADDYKTQWVHGGQTYDQFDSMAFARAIEAAHNIK